MSQNTNEQSASTAAASHTPGPWLFRSVTDERFNPAHVGYDIEAHPQFNNGFAIAHVSGSEERHANARLIAAAPELLDALKLLARLEPECDDDDALLIAARAQAFAAITKATGRTP